MADDKRSPTPDLATVARASDKKALDEKLRKALDNPGLDAAIGRVKPKLKPGEDPLYFDVNRVSLTSMTPPAGVAAVPAPAAAGDDEPTLQRSPWAQNATGAPLDADALPSSHVPNAAPPTSVPIAAAKPGKRRSARALLGDAPPWLKSALALLAVVAPVTLVLLATRTPRVDEPRTVPSALPAAASAPATSDAGSSPPPASAATPPVALSSTADAAAPPPAATSAVAPPPHRVPGQPKGGPSDDPYDTAPSAPPSPAPTVAPAPQPPTPPPSSSSPKVIPIY
jgi:hypothetical protein